MLKNSVFLQEIDGRKNPAKGGGQDGTGTAHYALSGTGASGNHTGNHGKGVKPNENPHRCPCSTQRFRKGRIRVGRKVTLEEVRSVLANLSRSGQKETVLKLLQKHGGSRLSEVPPERYAALFADAQEAAHAE